MDLTSGSSASLGDLHPNDGWDDDADPTVRLSCDASSPGSGPIPNIKRCAPVNTLTLQPIAVCGPAGADAVSQALGAVHADVMAADEL